MEGAGTTAPEPSSTTGAGGSAGPGGACDSEWYGLDFVGEEPLSFPYALPLPWPVDPFAGESDGGDAEVATGAEAGAGVEGGAGAATGVGVVTGAGAGLDGWSVGAVPGAPPPGGWPPPAPGCDVGGAATRCDPESLEPAGLVAGGPDRVSLWTAFAAPVAAVAARAAVTGRAATVPS